MNDVRSRKILYREPAPLQPSCSPVEYIGDWVSRRKVRRHDGGSTTRVCRGIGETAYVEGDNVTVAYRWAENKIDRVPELAAELVPPEGSLKLCGLQADKGIGLEGIVSKRKDSGYQSGRSPHWIKSKNPNAPAARREAEEDWGRWKA